MSPRCKIAGAALVGAVLFAGCGASPKAMIAKATGDVLVTDQDRYEATGRMVFVTAMITDGDGKKMRPAAEIDAITWHVSPGAGGVFQRKSAGMQFDAGGPGTYEIWASASPESESPRITLAVPPSDQMRAVHSAARIVDSETMIRAGRRE